MVKGKQIVTPIVEVVWDNLRKPNEYGFVQATLALDPKQTEHKLFLGKLRKYYESEVADAKRPPYWEETKKDTDEKTGRYLIRVSTKELRKITDVNEIDLTFVPMMARGTKVIACCGISNKNGYVNLWLNELQIVELIEYQKVGQNKEGNAPLIADDEDIPF